ncbi:MAG: DUF1232 domain-containing protein [Chloroflexi bacterium]|nr:DUF1232 domain-containing protein [Chloroflexota bacterium]
MIQSIFDQIQLTWRLLRDERVPLTYKAIPVGALLYVLSPLDILPDVIPILGQIDDLTIVFAAMRLFEAMAPEAIVNEHKGAIKRKRG